MTTPTNWPDPAQPGVPLLPDRDGWHVVLIEEDRHEYWWDAEYSYWTTAPDGDLIWTIEEAAFEFSYIGPTLTPAQIAEMLAAERDRCSNVCKTLVACEENQYGVGLKTTSAEARVKALAEVQRLIRNLGAAP